jgi:hypothetical protein
MKTQEKPMVTSLMKDANQKHRYLPHISMVVTFTCLFNLKQILLGGLILVQIELTRWNKDNYTKIHHQIPI